MMKVSRDVWAGLVLLASALLAIVVVNTGYADAYYSMLHWDITLGFGPFILTKSLQHWVNDGLMVLFFVVVGIEIHRALREGELRDPRKAALPLLAAFGGVAVPALIYVLISWDSPEAVAGWSVPTATDIAFAVALVTALGSRIPPSLRIFLLTLAVTDDLIAILVIALFYSQGLVWMNLLLASAAVVGLIVKNQTHLRHMGVYVLAGFLMWICVLKSGVHATLAGVLLGVLLPLHGKNGRISPAHTMEEVLQPSVQWFILPLFAFTNMGLDLSGLGWDMLLAPVTLGVTLGLFVGKQIGIFGLTWVLVRVGLCAMPTGSTWRQIYGVALICGIGFTMSLFIGTLAFTDPILRAEVQLGVLVGSLASAVCGALVLLTVKR